MPPVMGTYGISTIRFPGNSQAQRTFTPAARHGQEGGVFMEWYWAVSRAGNIVFDLFLQARSKEEAYWIAIHDAAERAGYIPALFIVKVQKLIFRRVGDYENNANAA